MFSLVILVLIVEEVSATPAIPPASDLTQSEHDILLKIYQEVIVNGPEISGVERQGWPFINNLVREASPYLLQHASDPVDWHNWSDATLLEAVNKGKLIFLSVGFSTCYWCQIMKKESFHDLQIATQLNTNFVSIKLDRELLPDIDSFFVNALEKVKGTAGWPVTAVLTANAELLYIESYLTKGSLMHVLKRYAASAKDNPEQLQRHVSLMSRIVGVDKEFNGVEPVTISDWPALKEQLKQAIDKKHGGVSGQPKFPEAAMLLFMIDSWWRTQDTELLSALHLQLQRMASRGLYDHVHGGFHRYVSDETWAVPHYEKMLYTQAMMLLVYSKASQLPGGQHYRDVVFETIAFLDKFMKTENGLFASAIDAVYQGIEGGFYLYPEEVLGKIGAFTLHHAGITLYSKNNLYGLHVERPYSEKFENIKGSLSGFYDQSDLIIDTKAITSWNALLVWALTETYSVFNDVRLKGMAEKLAEQLLKINRNGDQLYRASLVAQRDSNAALEDYAFLIRALIALYDISAKEEWLNEAMSFYHRSLTIVDSIQEPIKSGIKIKPQFTDGELLNPHSVMYDVATLLWQRTGKVGYRDDALQLNSTINHFVSTQFLRQFYAAKSLQVKQSGSLELVQYFAQSNGKVAFGMQSDCTRLFKVQMTPGWHINSEQPLDSELIPTTLRSTITPFKQVHFPVSKNIHFGPGRESISVFSERFTIISEGGSGVAQLQVQACSDEDGICLLPETLEFPLPECHQSLK